MVEMVEMLRMVEREQTLNVPPVMVMQVEMEEDGGNGAIMSGTMQVQVLITYITFTLIPYPIIFSIATRIHLVELHKDGKLVLLGKLEMVEKVEIVDVVLKYLVITNKAFLVVMEVNLLIADKRVCMEETISDTWILCF